MTTLPYLIETDRSMFDKLQFKSRPEDFAVEELALYEPSGTGTHTWFWIEKRKLNTHDAVTRLARALNKRSRDAGLAGLKDAQAVSRQWITFEHVNDGLEKNLDLGDGLKIVAVNRHGNKLKMGHLKGNRFLIRLRWPDGEEGQAKPHAFEWARQAQSILDQLHRQGVPNYFGPQRFGRVGNNATLGRHLVQGDEAAFMEAALAAGTAPKRARDRKFRGFMVNALQAQLFNGVLASRMDSLGRLRGGDLAYLHRNGAVFLVEDPAVEQPRCDAFEISPSGPLFGPKMTPPQGQAFEIEQAVLREAELSVDQFGSPLAQKQPGARRALRVPFLEAPEAKATDGGIELSFALPSGSYATSVMRELVGDEGLAHLPES